MATFVALSAAAVFALLCEPFCVEECSVLNGDIGYECGACAAGSGCYPGASGWREVADPSVMKAAAAPKVAAAPVAASPEVALASSLYDTSAEDLQTGEPVALSKYRGKALLIVNLASKCGFADETHTQLNELNQRYGARGLSILGFPSDDFDQMPGGADEITRFAQDRGFALDGNYDAFRKVPQHSQCTAHPLGPTR